MSTPTSDTSFTDLEIRIFRCEDVGYPVEITLGGQQEFDRGCLTADILPWIRGSDAIADGQRLFSTLLSASALHGAWHHAEGKSRRRRIRLRIGDDAPELHTLPWELLHNGSTFLSADAHTPFSRYLPIALPWGDAVEERPIRVLVVISNPSDLEESHNLAQLDVALEQSVLEEAFGELKPGEIEITFLEPPVTLERLEEALRKGCYVLHYLGHGAFSQRRRQAVLYLEDEQGKTQVVTDDKLSGMLARQGVQPRLVFLAACQSATRPTADAFLGLAPKLVTAGVPAVVAMQDSVAIKTARKLSRVFYRQLAEHGVVDQAMNEARSTLVTAGRPDATVPVLFMRLLDGQLWGSLERASSHFAVPDIRDRELTYPALKPESARRVAKVATFEHSKEVLSIAFSPDGKWLASGTGDQLALWDVPAQTAIGAGSPGGLSGGAPDYQILGVDFSPDGQTIACALGWRVYLYDRGEGKRVSKISRRWWAAQMKTPVGATSVAFSPDGKLLASAWVDGVVHLWDVPKQTKVAELRGHSGRVSSVTFGPEGEVLASAGDDKAICLWDTSLWTKFALLGEHQWGIEGIAFSPDGQVLAVASGWSVHMWDVTRRAKLAKLDGHKGIVQDVAFSPDGQVLASASRDETVRLWDVAAQTPVARLIGHKAEVTSVVFSPDGRLIASGSRDERVWLWRMQ